MADIDFSTLAEDALSTFSEIEDNATNKLSFENNMGTDSFASGNTLTGNQAFQNLASIKQANREQLIKLCHEPAIARLVIGDDNENQKVIYIARNANLPLPSGRAFASYRSPIGRLAEVALGDEAKITIEGKAQLFYVIEKTSFRPKKEADGWDSNHTQYRHYYSGTYSIESLRALLQANDFESADELDQLLEQAEAQSGVSAGISHQVRTAMGLRDQPILDQFQGEIFRLPLNSQLIILGPPGTGKTTTLIKRLGQKLDVESLEAEEKRFAETSKDQEQHQSSWIMFTPSELLKHYLKEAFSREQVPATDSHIRTWISFRNDIARNTLGILRTANGGKFTLKNDLSNLAPAVIEDASRWYESFEGFHEQRLKDQLKDGIVIATTAAPDTAATISKNLQKLGGEIESRKLIDIYRDLETFEDAYKSALSDSKTIAEDLLKKERNRLYNKDKEIFHRLAKYLETLQQENEPDDEELFDDDEQEDASVLSSNAIQVAVKAYLSAIRALARTKYLKRSMPTKSRSLSIIRFLETSIPSDNILVEIGKHISFQNGLRRFVNSHKRYVSDVSTSYRDFRKTKTVIENFYDTEVTNTTQLSSIELDVIILLMLKKSRQLMTQGFVGKALDETKYSYLVVISDLFKNQVMVDEATDFSMLQLACMESLTSLKSKSFFACGDFNQRITSSGIRSQQQLTWILPRISVKPIQLVYRQSRILNEFAGELLRIQNGDLSALGMIPEESNHIGVKPVLCEKAGDDKSITWIAERIMEVERAVQQLPTIAVLVNSEEEVKPMAERLANYLEHVNLSVVACEEGKALGEGTDIRVFDIQHIKGLEFEAVFFAGIDKLAIEKPDLFDRYLYVGATRAATYLALVCYDSLPTSLEPLRGSFDLSWGE
ncbi:ATP-binding domain-containing protein [Neptunomonas qingdaonensis]|uniref:Part of AAA domain-containing protein n=1 Tax=Neptunomonas qingdaonensis TaxID=1045558 RepID=A0A1I2Q617_9GAMM|nr:ATP-binding domain-containing protein [Neptunomonas qingdaonensis]SFG23822.1 Part of AAA domain-containing protein [Neptunomonas qingdaonensis]